MIGVESQKDPWVRRRDTVEKLIFSSCKVSIMDLLKPNLYHFIACKVVDRCGDSERFMELKERYSGEATLLFN